MSLEKLLDDIMNTDLHIRYATICDMDGNEIQTSIRENVTPLLNDEETKETLHYAVNAWKTRSKFVPKIGKGKYVLAVYERLRRLTMPIGDLVRIYCLDSQQMLYVRVIWPRVGLQGANEFALGLQVHRKS